jgi:hypothetical protein
MFKARTRAWVRVWSMARCRSWARVRVSVSVGTWISGSVK